VVAVVAAAAVVAIAIAGTAVVAAGNSRALIL
jgi:hypothetical protein